jgi:3-deoxy-manno-octulosonate cytidylyltransferase (CMP-KDO synthetase)
MKIIGIIPARYASSRFPGKPLVNFGGKTMIRRVYEQALKATGLSEVMVATDDERIYHEVKNFGGKVVITSPTHKNGTERCAEVAAQLQADVVVNIQGDEPFIHPEQIDLLARSFETTTTQIATLVKEQPLNEELHNHARVKVVMNNQGEAMYFSRNVIPFVSQHSEFTIHGFQSFKKVDSVATAPAETSPLRFFKHIGIYAYRSQVLQELVKLEPTPLELAESLEQLRWLENGYRITCVRTMHDSLSIDTPQDIDAVKHLL